VEPGTISSLSMVQDLVGNPSTAAAIAGNRRVKSLPFLL
jgi:hypothetical protein